MNRRAKGMLVSYDLSTGAFVSQNHRGLYKVHLLAGLEWDVLGGKCPLPPSENPAFSCEGQRMKQTCVSEKPLAPPACACMWPQGWARQQPLASLRNNPGRCGQTSLPILVSYTQELKSARDKGQKELTGFGAYIAIGYSQKRMPVMPGSQPALPAFLHSCSLPVCNLQCLKTRNYYLACACPPSHSCTRTSTNCLFTHPYGCRPAAKSMSVRWILAILAVMPKNPTSAKRCLVHPSVKAQHTANYTSVS